MSETFGPYELIRKIAQGGMAEVFLARRRGEIAGFSKQVAIKRIFPHLAEDPDLISMFFDEARIAARLNHPNVVQIYELGEVAPYFYIAMEFVHGPDLRSLCERSIEQDNFLPRELAVRVVADCAAGLHAAHIGVSEDGQALGIIHRDVSPQNILVGMNGVVKLCDFGIAKAEQRLTQTRTGQFKGKFGYMSPEQAIGDGRPIDQRSDIFSLGIVLYEITVCSRLFRSKNDYETIRMVAEAEIVPPSQRVAGFPRGLERIIMKALARRPEDRYQSADLLHMALEEWLLEQRAKATSFHLSRYLQEVYPEHSATPVPAPQSLQAPTTITTAPAPAPPPAPAAPAVSLRSKLGGGGLSGLSGKLGGGGGLSALLPPPAQLGQSAPALSSPHAPVAAAAPPEDDGEWDDVDATGTIEMSNFKHLLDADHSRDAALDSPYEQTPPPRGAVVATAHTSDAPHPRGAGELLSEDTRPVIVSPSLDDIPTQPELSSYPRTRPAPAPVAHTYAPSQAHAPAQAYAQQAPAYAPHAPQLEAAHDQPLRPPAQARAYEQTLDVTRESADGSLELRFVQQQRRDRRKRAIIALTSVVCACALISLIVIYGRERDIPPLEGVAPPLDEITLEPPPPLITTRVPLDSAPQGARVVINGALAEQATPAEFELVEGLPNEILFLHEERAPRRVLVLGERKALEPFALEPIDALDAQDLTSLHVESTPPGATVTRDGVSAGQTPLTLTGLDPRRTYHVQLSMGGHLPVSAQVRPRPGENLPLRVTLDPEDSKSHTVYASLILQVTPSGAEVRLDGQPEGSTPANLNVQRGRLIAARLSAADHIAETRYLDPTGHGALLVRDRLSAIPRDPGKITVAVPADTAQLYLGNQSYGAQGVRKLELVEGRVPVVLELRDKRRLEGELEVIPKAHTRYTLSVKGDALAVARAD